MCYHASKTYEIRDLLDYYQDLESNRATDKWDKQYHTNGFDHDFSPVVINKSLENLSWGLIPWYTKSMQEALIIRNQTLNCISEEMWEKPSYRDSVKEGKRCLIPVTGFFEWEWLDSSGKKKQPYHIFLKDQKIFSIAGLHSSWANKETGEIIYTYTVLTTKANKLMEKIHNNKRRMPVIIERQYENDWLNGNLTKDDVNAFCQPFNTNLMDAYPISKRITSRTDPSNVPEVLEKATVAEPPAKKSPPPGTLPLFG
jgi:putative SOS response-associated peptidase YedK